jgi:hypothetical protein
VETASIHHLRKSDLASNPTETGKQVAEPKSVAALSHKQLPVLAATGGIGRLGWPSGWDVVLFAFFIIKKLFDAEDFKPRVFLFGDVLRTFTVQV